MANHARSGELVLALPLADAGELDSARPGRPARRDALGVAPDSVHLALTLAAELATVGMLPHALGGVCKPWLTFTLTRRGQCGGGGAQG